MKGETQGTTPLYRRGAPSYRATGGQKRLTINTPHGIAHVVNEACDREGIGPSEFIRRLVTWYVFDEGRCDDYFAGVARESTARVRERFPGYQTHFTIANAARKKLDFIETLYGQGSAIFPGPVSEELAGEIRALGEAMQINRSRYRQIVDPATTPAEAEAIRDQLRAEIGARFPGFDFKEADAPIEQEVDIATLA